MGKKRTRRPKTTDITPAVGIPDGTPVGALVPQKHGGAIRNGGTNIGGPGRPPDEFKALCRSIASGQTTLEQVMEILKNKDHQQFMAALKWATENGYGKPDQHVTGSAAVVVKVIYSHE